MRGGAAAVRKPKLSQSAAFCKFRAERRAMAGLAVAGRIKHGRDGWKSVLSAPQRFKRSGILKAGIRDQRKVDVTILDYLLPPAGEDGAERAS